MVQVPRATGTLVVAALCVGVFILVAVTQVRTVEALYEDVMFRIAPSSDRAYTYAARHFDAIHAERYDVKRAKHYFNQALKLDPGREHTYHQLARIAFLDGDFSLALRYINQEIELNSEPTASSYYVRGLIKGFAGDYAGAVVDYETYLRTDSKNWAAITDYSWVLIKDHRPKEALVALDWGLLHHPNNPWLLNTKATALFEMGQLDSAREAVMLAAHEVQKVTESDWLTAYPGNDPLIAREGVAQFHDAVLENMHTISQEIEKRESGVR